MADDADNKGQKPETGNVELERLQSGLPEGYRIVQDDDYKLKAEAGADLKKFKSVLPKELQSPDKLSEALTNLTRLMDDEKKRDDARKSAIEKAEEKAALAERAAQDKALKLDAVNRQLLIERAINSSNLPIDQAFVDVGRVSRLNLEVLDTDEFKTEVADIVKTAWERQKEVVNRSRPVIEAESQGAGGRRPAGPPEAKVGGTSPGSSPGVTGRNPRELGFGSKT